MAKIDLSAHRRALVASSQRASRRRKKLEDEVEETYEMVEKYNEKWEKLFESEIGKRALTWCTICLGVIKKSEAKIVLITDIRKESCGYEGGDWCWNNHGGLHRACPNCFARLKARDGWHGEVSYDRTEQEKFLVYDVVEKEGGFYRGTEALPHWQRLPEFDDRHRGRDNAKARTNLAIACRMPPKYEYDGLTLEVIKFKRHKKSAKVAETQTAQ